MATQRLFVGLPLPQGYQQGLAKLQESLKEVLSGKFTWTRPGNWHLTLKFLGDTPEDLLPAVEEALAGVSFSRLSPRRGRGGLPLGYAPQGHVAGTGTRQPGLRRPGRQD